MSDTTATLAYDLRDVFTQSAGPNIHRANRITGVGVITDPAAAASANGNHYFVRGWSLWLHPNDGLKSNFDLQANNLPAEGAQSMRNRVRDEFRIGNSFTAATWTTYNLGAAEQGLTIYDYAFATSYTGPFFIKAGTSIFMGKMTEVTHHTHYTAADANANTAADHLGIELRFPVYHYDAAAGDVVQLPRQDSPLTAHGQGVNATLQIVIPGKDWWAAYVTAEPFGAIADDSKRLGAVFQSIKRISQHVCAPVLNPNLRIGSTAPLNHDSRHLPPEMRDFRLQLQDIDWSRLRTDKVSINELTLYEFRDGVQKVGAEQNVLYLPQFREFKNTVQGGAFDITVFSELGAPSYYCFFCRSATTDILQQPKIQELSIRCETTKKKSNTITDSTAGQLYHLTQRNVHPGAGYDRNAFKRRQTILLSAEDVGLMGLKTHQYQSPKRVEYTFTGVTDRPGTLYAVFVYNNRGLHIDGRRLHIVMLHE